MLNSSIMLNFSMKKSRFGETSKTYFWRFFPLFIQCSWNFELTKELGSLTLSRWRKWFLLIQNKKKLLTFNDLLDGVKKDLLSISTDGYNCIYNLVSVQWSNVETMKEISWFFSYWKEMIIADWVVSVAKWKNFWTEIFSSDKNRSTEKNITPTLEACQAKYVSHFWCHTKTIYHWWK